MEFPPPEVPLGLSADQSRCPPATYAMDGWENKGKYRFRGIVVSCVNNISFGSSANGIVGLCRRAHILYRKPASVVKEEKSAAKEVQDQAWKGNTCRFLVTATHF